MVNPKLIISVNGKERIKILSYVIKFAKVSQVPLDIVIVEQDVQQLYSWVKNEGCEYIFAYSPNGFNRAWGFNVGVANSTPADIYILSDADLIFPPDYIYESIGLMQKREMPVILPFKQIKFVKMIELEIECVQKIKSSVGDVIETDIIARINKLINVDRFTFHNVMNNYPHPLYTHSASCGGICICTKDYYHKTQGYNEMYEWWGCEDVDWSHKAFYLTGKHLTFNRTPHVLMHVRHPTMKPGFQSVKKHHENLAMTKQIWNINKEETVKLLKEGSLQPEWGCLNKYVEKKIMTSGGNIDGTPFSH